MNYNNQRPVMLGIVGDSATGKTTLTHGIQQLLGPERVTVICIDDYHKYNRDQRKELNITPLHPDCNYIDIMTEHLRLLREGKPILKPVYNHTHGVLDPPTYIKPNEFIIVEGLLAYYNKKMRDVFDVKVFLEPEEALRRRWKVTRDTTKRGYTVAQVLTDIERRMPEAEAFIRPQRAYADTIVSFYPEVETGQQLDSFLNVKLIMTGDLQHPDFSQVVTRPDGANGVRLASGRYSGKVAEFVDISGRISEQKARRMEHYILQELDLPGMWPERDLGLYTQGALTQRSHPLALTQLFLAYHLVRARHSEEANMLLAANAC
jgi:phosphoribulokinase